MHNILYLKYQWESKLLEEYKTKISIDLVYETIPGRSKKNIITLLLFIRM